MPTNEENQTRDRSETRQPIKVLIVDDVKSARDLLRDILATDLRFKVVGEVGNGLEAVGVASKLRPNLITMDIRLPGLDGFLAVERILSEYPVPIVMITASMENQEETLFRAFNAGALDVLDKQELYLWRTRPEIRSNFIRKLRALTSARVRRGVSLPAPVPEVFTSVVQSQRKSVQTPLAVAIAASTGGPGALVRLFRRIPRQVSASFIVVQHMSEGFLGGLVRWLNDEVELAVRKAKGGDLLEPGVVLIAPEDYHIVLNDMGSVRLNKSLPINGHRPSAELLFDSVANHCGKLGFGIMLTGMGSDGAKGLKSLRLCGGRTIAQDEETSIIFGMPHAAIELDAVEMVLPLEMIAGQILTWISEQQEKGNRSSLQPR